MILGILEHTPIWVWLVLGALLVLGLVQTRARTISRARAAILPLLFVALSLSSVLRGSGSFPIALAAWTGGAAVAWALARRAVAIRDASWCASTASFHVPGSWLPLTLIVGLFLCKYTTGVTQALNPGRGSEAAFVGAANFVYGVFAGLFWARSWSLRALVPAPARSAAAAPEAQHAAAAGAAMRHT